MASNQLSASGGSGSQQATPSSIQGAQQSFSGGTPISTVQPGGPNLQSSANAPLSGVTLSLANTTPQTSTQANPATPASPKHHANPVLIGFSALLIIAAIVLFVLASRPVKSTT